MRRICVRRRCLAAFVGAMVTSGLLFAAPGIARAQPYSPVSAENVVDLKLNHYFTPDKKSHAADFVWTFTKSEFVLKKGTRAIPADLIDKLLGMGATAEEIRGKWQVLADKDGQRLVLTEISAGAKIGRKDVSLSIYKTAPTVVRIGEPQYVFGIGR